MVNWLWTKEKVVLEFRIRKFYQFWKWLAYVRNHFQNWSRRAEKPSLQNRSRELEKWSVIMKMCINLLLPVMNRTPKQNLHSGSFRLGYDWKQHVKLGAMSSPVRSHSKCVVQLKTVVIVGEDSCLKNLTTFINARLQRRYQNSKINK